MMRIIKVARKAFAWYIKHFHADWDKDLEIKYWDEALRFWQLTHLYNATNHTDDDMHKMQYTLLRENHVLEKGLSMRDPRKGFGQEKVAALITRLENYCERYGNTDIAFMQYPLSTIKTYIKYTKENGTDIPEIERRFDALCQLCGNISIEVRAGVRTMTREELLSACDNGFESLLHSRHSIRYFAPDYVDDETIIKALQMAQRTPSACNRQAWKTHVYRGEESKRLMYWQEGCRGCEEEFKQSILVTADLKAFLWHEPHQAYIDGALYAMNLINALHSLGLGCIPLSCGFQWEKLRYLDGFGIPENEVPIVIVAFGNVNDEFKVAESTRKDITQTNTFH